MLSIDAVKREQFIHAETSHNVTDLCHHSEQGVLHRGLLLAFQKLKMVSKINATSRLLFANQHDQYTISDFMILSLEMGEYNTSLVY